MIAAAGRPHPGETVSGDNWTVDRSEATYRIALIDGLGHGPAAAAAADAAVQVLADRPQALPTEALHLCHRALKGSRGAAIAVASIDPLAGRLSYAGVGNVEARLWQAGSQTRPISHRGIVGAVLPRLQTFNFTLGADWILILHTDGVSDRFDLDELLTLANGDRQRLADSLVQRWSRPSDDATAVIACPDSSA
jgi:serine phosphatase RsbU (regulator of sigma subunit)